MLITKRQKAGSLVAALALLALGADRFILGGGGPATASAQNLLPEPSIEPPQPGLPATAPPKDTLASRLAQYAAEQGIDPEGGVPDLFSQEGWQILAVFGEGTRGGVKIDDRIVRVGGQYDGATLVSVSRQGATFSKAGQEFFVAFEPPALGSGNASVSNGR